MLRQPLACRRELRRTVPRAVRPPRWRPSPSPRQPRQRWWECGGGGGNGTAAGGGSSGSGGGGNARGKGRPRAGGGSHAARQGEPAHPDRDRRGTRRRRGACAALAASWRSMPRASRSPSGWSVRGSTARPRTWCSTSVPIGCSPTTRRRSSRSRRRCVTPSRPRCVNSASSTRTISRALARRRARPFPRVDRVGPRVRQAGRGRVPVPLVLHSRIAFARLPRMVAGPER